MCIAGTMVATVTDTTGAESNHHQSMKPHKVETLLQSAPTKGLDADIGVKRKLPNEKEDDIGMDKRLKSHNENDATQQLAMSALDPLSNDFPGLEESARLLDDMKAKDGKSNKEKSTGPFLPSLADPFDLGDHELSLSDLEMLEAETKAPSGIHDADDSIEIIGENIVSDSNPNTKQEAGKFNSPDFSKALKEIEGGLFEDDLTSISSGDDDDYSGSAQIKNYPLTADSAMIDLTGDTTPKLSSYPLSQQQFRLPNQSYSLPVNGALPQGNFVSNYPFDSQNRPIAHGESQAYSQAIRNALGTCNYPYLTYRSPQLQDRPLTKDSLEDLMKKNNLTADATSEEKTPDSIAVELMPHQKRALKWMRKRELLDASVRGGILADDQGLGKTLSAIALMVANQPKPVKLDAGGYAPADYDVECYNFPVETSIESDDDDEEKKKRDPLEGELPPHSSVIQRNESGRYEKAPWRTLIVCPVSLVHQWKEELVKRIRPEECPTIYIYHGKTKTQDIEELQAYDVVITTYSTLAQQYPKVLKNDPSYDACKEAKVALPTRPAGAMYKFKWFRVILDEAQYIKNRFTDNFQAVHSLRAYRRWCLTGTPIQNSVDDLYSQFMFIRYMIVKNYKEWQRVWKKKLESPYALTREQAFKQFQAVVGVVLLRRTKLDKIDNKPLISLPEKKVELKELDFRNSDEADYYRSVQVKTILDVDREITKGTIRNNYSSILLLLLRLRQAATHPHLTMSQQRTYNLSDAVHDPRKQPLLQQLKMMYGEAFVNVFTSDTPPVCYGCQSNAEAANSVISRCGHVTCVECIPDPFTTCLECQAPVASATYTLESSYVALKRYLNPESGVGNPGASVGNSYSGGSNPKVEGTHGEEQEVKHESSEYDGGYEKKAVSSTKLETLIYELHAVQKKDPEEKSLVFSQWTSMLDIIETSLRKRGFKPCRLDGSMAMNARRDQIERFKTSSRHTVMLISLHAGGTGLNLVVAKNVFLMDVWWNPAVEEQAIDRAHRIGQKSNVRVVRMKVKGTVEERIYELCAKKREMMNGALGAKGSQSLGRKKLTMNEIMNLFGSTAEDVLNTSNGQSNEAARAAANILAYTKNDS